MSFSHPVNTVYIAYFIVVFISERSCCGVHPVEYVVFNIVDWAGVAAVRLLTVLLARVNYGLLTLIVRIHRLADVSGPHLCSFV